MLPDLLRPGLDVVFCGTSVGDRSASAGHYYSGRGNDFWALLAQAGITPRQLSPHEDTVITEFGVGLTDLVKTIASSSDAKLRGSDFDTVAFERTVSEFEPRWVAFHGKKAASAYLKTSASVSLGVQTWSVAAAQVFVVPSASGSNRRSTYDGLATRLEWFLRLRDAVRGGENSTG